MNHSEGEQHFVYGALTSHSNILFRDLPYYTAHPSARRTTTKAFAVVIVSSCPKIGSLAGFVVRSHNREHRAANEVRCAVISLD